MARLGPKQERDGWIVYKGPTGPIDSIRWEETRDGVDDYELLLMAAKKNPAKTVGLVKQVVKSFGEYETSVENFRSVRHQVLELASRS